MKLRSAEATTILTRGVMVIGIVMDYQNPKTVLEFAESMFIRYPIVLGNRKIAAQIGKVPGLPTTYLYDPEGKLSGYQVGAVTRERIERYIEQNGRRKESRAGRAAHAQDVALARR